MAKEISKFYTCVPKTPAVNKNENIHKKYSLPDKLSAESYDSNLSLKVGSPKENNLTSNNVNNYANFSKNQKECSELIIETQQKLENLRLESYIKTYPIGPYSLLSKEEKEKNKICYNYSEVINNDRINHKRKLSSNASFINNEKERSHKKQNSSGSHEKISGIKEQKSKKSFNNITNNNNYDINYKSCENNANRNDNKYNYGFNINSCEINENNNLNNENVINIQPNNDKINLTVDNKINQISNTIKDENNNNDYKKLNIINVISSNNKNTSECWAILQSINPLLPTIYLNEANKECIIGRNMECHIRFKSPHISGYHCKIYCVENRSKISGYITREYYLKDLSKFGTFVNGKLVGRGNTVNLYNGQSINFFKSKKMEKCFIFLINNDIIPEKNPGIEYIIHDDIGSGSFGRVCNGIRKSDNREVAIKIVNKSKLNSKPGTNLMKYLEREVNILKSIQHENIVQLFDVYEDSTNVYLVLELAKGGELFKRIKMLKRLNENQTRIIMKQLFNALEYLHSRGIAHRDLKPENILMINNDINDFSIKLSDFGLSRFVDENFYMRTLCGTPNYTAPEIFDKKIKNYTIAVDMWSCGVIMYICLCGYPPFSRKISNVPLKTQIMNGSYSFNREHWSNVSTEAKSLIRSLLQVNPENRLTISQALNHSFILKEDINMEMDVEINRKRNIQIMKNEASNLSNRSESLDNYTSHSNNSNSSNSKSKRQKLL